MLKALSLPLSTQASSRLWPLLVAELGLFLLLVCSDAAPPAALAALRLFLRF